MKKKSLKLLLIFSILFISFLGTKFLIENDLYVESSYILDEKGPLTKHTLEMNILYNEEEIKDIIESEKNVHSKTYDLTIIALKGCIFYYNYVSTNDLKYAQLSLYYANYLLSENNHQNLGDTIFFPSHVGGSFTSICWKRKYEDGMGASFAALLFLNIDELLGRLNISNDFYINCAHKTVNGLLKSIYKGGSIIKLDDNNIWFTHHSEERRVLNGHMYTIANLYRYINYTQRLDLMDYVYKGINSLKKYLPNYFKDSLQMYDYKIPVANTGYEEYYAPYYKVHPLLLYYISEISNDSELYDWYEIFLESSLMECEYTYRITPFIIQSNLSLEIEFTSSHPTIFNSNSLKPLSILPHHDYLFREPFANYSSLGKVRPLVKIKGYNNQESVEVLFENEIEVPNKISFVYNFTKYPSFQISLTSRLYTIYIDYSYDNYTLKFENERVLNDFTEIKELRISVESRIFGCLFLFFFAIFCFILIRRYINIIFIR